MTTISTKMPAIHRWKVPRLRLPAIVAAVMSEAPVSDREHARHRGSPPLQMLESATPGHQACFGVHARRMA